MATTTEVQERIDAVREAHGGATFALRERTWQTTATENAIKALGSLEQPIAKWAELGLSSAAASKSPGRKGWAGWIAAGDAFIAGINDLHEEGDYATLRALNETVVEAAEDVKRVAKRTKKILEEAAPDVGMAVAKATWPLWILGGLAVAGVYLVKRR